VERNAADLRSAVVGLIASAEARLVLASPFWDEETADELYAVLARRIDAGVRVHLLGRSLGGSSQAGLVLEELSRRLGAACRTFTWSRPAAVDPLGWETFHFKAAIADGQRAYLGTANFTVGGLRSRMELGFVAQGPLASAIARILDAVLAGE
jgi:phosphatidylserine/phosphatidylglycerophosphate/cardiolipin synthase-like enzyme